MTLVNTYIKETGATALSAQIHKNDVSFSIQYFINNELVKKEEFPGKSLFYVEGAAQNWLEGIKKLNG